MGGSTKKWMMGIGMGALAALTGGLGAAALGASSGIIAGAAGAAGVAAGAGGYAQGKAQEEQAAIARVGNKQAEIVAKREAGMTPQQTNTGNEVTDLLRRKSALRRTFITNSSNASQKLGD